MAMELQRREKVKNFYETHGFVPNPFCETCGGIGENNEVICMDCKEKNVKIMWVSKFGEKGDLLYCWVKTENVSNNFNRVCIIEEVNKLENLQIRWFNNATDFVRGDKIYYKGIEYGDFSEYIKGKAKIIAYNEANLLIVDPGDLTLYNWAYARTW